MKHPTNPIYFIERNIHGAWVIYGIDGVKQYYYYTKKQAANLYKKECERYFVNER